LICNKYRQNKTPTRLKRAGAFGSRERQFKCAYFKAQT